MKCGHCKNDHETVAEVRECSTTYAVSTGGGVFRPTLAEQQEIASRRTPVTEAGMYQRGGPNGPIIKVQKSRDSDRLYGKLLTVDAPNAAHFVYKAGLLRDLAAEDKMTLEAARAFGQLYGVCCKCGATLTDETSIERGIGPFCEQGGWRE